MRGDTFCPDEPINKTKFYDYTRGGVGGRSGPPIGGGGGGGGGGGAVKSFRRVGGSVRVGPA